MSSESKWLYYAEFYNGHCATFGSYEEVNAYCDQNSTDVWKMRARECEPNGLKASKRMKRDGFQPGFNPALGMHVGSRTEHNRILKERNLIEVGTENFKQTFTPQRETYLTDDVVKELHSSGCSLTEGQVREIRDTSSN